MHAAAALRPVVQLRPTGQRSGRRTGPAAAGSRPVGSRNDQGRPPDDELVDHTTAAALEEKAKLQKHFGRFDMFFFLLCTLVGLDTLGAVASNGAQAFTWLVFLGSSSSSRTRC